MPPPGGPTLVTTEGEPVVFCTALYRQTGMDEVVQILAQADDFDLGEAPEPGPDGTLAFGWYEVGPGKRPLSDPMARCVLASLTLAAETLEIGTMSESRLARCWETACSCSGRRPRVWSRRWPKGRPRTRWSR